MSPVRPRSVGLGAVAVRTIEGWHREVEDVDAERSAYVVLTHEQGKVEYELFWFPLRLPDCDELAWEIRRRRPAAAQTPS